MSEEPDFVLLESADGYTFVVERRIACASGMLKSMLDEEGESGAVTGIRVLGGSGAQFPLPRYGSPGRDEGKEIEMKTEDMELASELGLELRLQLESQLDR